MPEFVDVIVPRGGKGASSSASPTTPACPSSSTWTATATFMWTTFADPAKALAIVENAKTQRYGTCNTTESLLVDAAVARPAAAIGRMLAGKGVEVRAARRPGHPARSRHPDAQPKAAVDRLVRGFLAHHRRQGRRRPRRSHRHINRTRPSHTEAIVTENYTRAMRFLREVDPPR